MNRFLPILFLGIFCIGLGLYGSFQNHPYDCKSLPLGYWNNTCQKFNIESSGVFLSPIGLGIFTIVMYFKVLKTQEPNDKTSEGLKK